MKLKSRTQSPPNGFRYFQPETGWRSWDADPPSMWDFNRLVEAVRSHRLANPKFNLSTNRTVIDKQVDEANANRMMTIPGADIYVDQALPPKTPALHSLSPKLAAAVEGAKKTSQGFGLILDWLKSGVPVDSPTANRRALTCISCPKNNTKNTIYDIFVKAASELIRKQIESRADLALKTPHDQLLGICDGCLCPLKTKIWVPINEVREHLTDTIKNDLWPQCWMLTEPPTTNAPQTKAKP